MFKHILSFVLLFSVLLLTGLLFLVLFVLPSFVLSFLGLSISHLDVNLYSLCLGFCFLLNSIVAPVFVVYILLKGQL